MSARSRTHKGRPQQATKRTCSRSFLVGVAAAALAGCHLIGERPQVIAVPGDQVPHHLEKDEAAPREGWLLPTPLFNELLPCFKEHLEAGDGQASEDPQAES